MAKYTVTISLEFEVETFGAIGMDAVEKLSTVRGSDLCRAVMGLYDNQDLVNYDCDVNLTSADEEEREDEGDGE